LFTRKLSRRRAATGAGSLCIGACLLLAIPATSWNGSARAESAPAERRAPFAAPAVLVEPFDLAGAADLSPEFDAGPALACLLETQLSAAGRITIVRPYAVPESRRLSSEARARLLGADLIVSVRYQIQAERLRAELTVANVRNGRKYAADGIEGLRSAPGQFVYAVAIAFFETAAGEGLTPTLLTPDEQRELARRFRPTREPFEHFARGFSRERPAPAEALRQYRRALALEPYFLEARDRAFFAAYQSAPNPRAAARMLNLDYAAQLRSGRTDLVNYGALLSELAFSRQSGGDAAGAGALFTRALAALRAAGAGDSADAALCLNALGAMQLDRQAYGPAYNYLAEARRLFDLSGFPASAANDDNLAALAATAALAGRRNVALDAFARLEKSYALTGQNDATEGALLRYNRALVRLRDPAGDATLVRGDLAEARRIFFRNGWVNSELYIEALVNEAIAEKRAGNLEEAEAKLERARLQLRMLGLENASIYPATLANLARLRALRGDRYNANRLGLQARRALRHDYKRRWTLTRSILSIEDMRAAGLRFLQHVPGGSDIFYTRDEEDQVRGWTGAFRIERHHQGIVSRTYAGRLDDTNVLLFDLLNDRQRSSPGLNRLRDMFAGGSVALDGRGLTFIDIGPAIANLENPAITTQSLARDFPAMRVIAFDLPEQVDFFFRQVSRANQERVRAFPNLHVVAGDGYLPLLAQLQSAQAWRLTDREPARPRSGQPIVLRAANSIDIYGRWDQIAPVLRNIAADFKDSPLLFFFNQSLLMKPRGETRYRVVGFLSVRGFHHNVNSLDRGGDPPYTLPGDLFTP
jgi:hypothetical protein